MKQLSFTKKHYLFDSKIYYAFLHIILFFYVYSVQFIFIPFNLGTRVLIGILGFGTFCIEIIRSPKKIVFNRYFLGVYFSLFTISVISFISLLYNGTNQSDFVIKYQFSIIAITLASYWVTKMVNLKHTGMNDVPLIMKLFINVVVIQIIIALLMFSVPPLRDLFNDIQVTSDKELEVLESTLEFRLVGFGSKFFGSGIINGFALIVIGSVIKFSKNLKISIFKYAISFLFIFVFGMMMARTTVVGALLSFGIMFWPHKKFNFIQMKKNLKFILYLILIPLILLVVIFYLFPNIKESLELAFNFGFEMFVNYFESNSLESESTNQMKEMYIWPSTLKTYLIGDGLFSDISTGSYYMGTDIGILRLIYYFGIFGLVTYLIFQFKITYAAYSKNKDYKYMFLVFYLYMVILNYKGFTDLFFLIILFYINNTAENKFSDEKNIIHNSISSQ